MPVSVKLPALGESVTEGTVTRWLKQEGDQVEADEPLLEVSTDKVDTEIPSPASGTLSKIVVAEDETVEVGAELAIINDGGSGEAAPAPAAEEPAAAEPAPEPEPEPEPAAEAQAPAAEPEPAPAAASGGDGARTPVSLPALGESVTEGTVTRWLKQVGDSVAVDEPLLEVSTDKVDTEIPSPVAGTLLEITVGEDETAPVGAQLAVVGTSDGAAAPAAAPAATPEPAAEAPQPAAEPEAPKQEAPKQEAPAPAAAAPAPAAPAPVPAPAQQTANGDASGAYVTPLVRKLAAEHNVDLSSVQGSGVGGRIRKQDILDAAAKAKAAAAAPAPAAAPSTAPAPSATGAVSDAAAALRGKTEPLSRIRKLIAKRMVQSLQTAAQLTTVIEVDVTKIAKLRQQVKNDFLAREGVKLSFLPFFALATVEALRQHPLLNATWEDEETVTYHDAEHLGIAVDSPRGLVVPVVHNAGDLNLAGLARKIADLAERVRTNKASPDELGGGSFTLTNTGSRGALFDTPILNQPQVGMLGTGSVVKRAVVVDDEEHGEIIVPRSMVYLALTYDHRLVDGADAARFLVTIKERLEGGSFQSELGLS
ncbi:2-oxoglutarate dehydrogenase, E2 component, dihydrolipoamide succinyltransferase [Fodinicola acaciae]|uniref:2-oxoglutarate dehydrogenase, E2 component, dihydrolipoamide succinyltransferase n=1 Tax=Fodinicola acaciae TaxID=2681555 RepID=UPI0013D7D91C|nr:2-oxoglutarate dehydrogenase, E2 component, dihydrolipoamide succinyltransferase [Fodinicola acaciae]